jgi:hypothetical protein
VCLYFGGFAKSWGFCVKSLESQESRPEWANTFGSRGREAPVGDLKYAKARRADTFWANHWHFQIPKIIGTPSRDLPNPAIDVFQRIR